MDTTSNKSKMVIVSGIIMFIVLVLLITFPLYRPGYPVVLMSSILMYVILTVSWVLFSGPTGYVSLAPAAFFGVGIYSVALLGKMFPFPVVVVVGGLAELHAGCGSWCVDLEVERDLLLNFHLRSGHAHRPGASVLGAPGDGHAWPVRYR